MGVNVNYIKLSINGRLTDEMPGLLSNPKMLGLKPLVLQDIFCNTVMKPENANIKDMLSTSSTSCSGQYDSAGQPSTFSTSSVRSW